MTRIVVSGAIANKLHAGGATWTRLSYVKGFQMLGFDTYFVEEIDPVKCVDHGGKPSSVEGSENLAYFDRTMAQFGLQGKAALLETGTGRAYGLPRAQLREIAYSAALLVNISGHLRSGLRDHFRKKAYIDLDPGYTQFWQQAGIRCTGLENHNYYFTVGENIGNSLCSIPVNGTRWRPTRQPVVLDQWLLSNGGPENRFTTIASWRGPYGPVQHGETTYGAKVRQFRRIIDLPLRSNGVFEIALDIHPNDRKDRELLCRNAWRLVDPHTAAGDAEAFRQYVQGSSAEFSVAQEIYVATNSGWFSDRSVRYLASGKPVLVEQTGFSRTYPVGDGLLSFATLPEAVSGAEDIQKRYSAHRRAARQIAETYFDSNIVLGQIAEEVGIAP